MIFPRLLLVMAMMPFGVFGQERIEPAPTDQDVAEQMKRLDPKMPTHDRLEAIQWLKAHSDAKNANLAIAPLGKCIREDPEVRIRNAAVISLVWIAKNRKDPCPLAIIEAMLDKDEIVSQSATALAGHFKGYPPGSLDVLVRCAQSENDNLRGNCLGLIAAAGGKEKKALDALEKAKQDKSFGVRHNAHVALFQASDNLAEFLAYLIRLQEDPDGVLSQVDPDSEVGRMERTTRGLVNLGAVLHVVEWSDKRSDDLAPALLKLLDSPSPEMRRGAARLIGASAVKVDLADGNWQKFLDAPPDASKLEKPLQRSKVAARFEKLKVDDRLRKLRDDDADPSVRDAARKALERLALVREK